MRQFVTTLPLVCIAASIAAYVYSQQQHISSSIPLAVVPAFLVEILLYLAPGFPAARKKFDALGSKPLRAAILSASGVLPYLIEASRLGSFQWIRFIELLGIIL